MARGKKAIRGTNICDKLTEKDTFLKERQEEEPGDYDISSYNQDDEEEKDSIA